MNDNYNTNRGDGETLASYLERLGELLSRIRWQSEGHRMWYTHKNPYGCWICELLQIGDQLRADLLAEGKSDDRPGTTKSEP